MTKATAYSVAFCRFCLYNDIIKSHQEKMRWPEQIQATSALKSKSEMQLMLFMEGRYELPRRMQGEELRMELRDAGER